MPGDLQFGRIVWTEIADANGIPKLRPVVLVTPSDRITPTAPLDVIAVTSCVPEPLPPAHVLLPWHAQGHPRTGLNRRCAAVCTWVARIHPTDIRDVADVVPGAVMLEILSKVPALRSPPSDPPSNARQKVPGRRQPTGLPPLWSSSMDLDTRGKVHGGPVPQPRSSSSASCSTRG